MDAKATYRQLSSFSIFKKWTYDDLNQLAQLVRERAVPSGTAIFTAGARSDDAYIVSQGQVRQTVEVGPSADWLFRTLRTGDGFSQQALFRGARYDSTAVAETDCLLYVIEAPDLLWALTKYPDLWKQLIQPDVSGRLRAIPLLRSLSDAQIEHLASSVSAHEFKPGQSICRQDQPDGALWIIDWGMVQIKDQGEIYLSSGQPTVITPSPSVASTQGFDLGRETVLAPGNWFVGGLAMLPGQMTVSAKAKSAAKLLRIPAPVLETTIDNFPDVERQLGQRLHVEPFMRQVLTSPPFAQLQDAHWQQLAQIAMLEHVPSGVNVVKQGEKQVHLRILLAGEAVTRARDDQGRERPRQTVQPYKIFGTAALQTPERSEFTIRSTTSPDPNTGEVLDGSDWLALNRDDIRYVLRADPGLWAGTDLRKGIAETKKKKEFPWQEPEETVAYRGRRHIIALIPALLTPLVIWLVVMVLMFILAPNMAANLLSAPLVLAVLIFLILPIPVWNYLDDYYAVTNLRVVRRNRTLFLHEVKVEAPLERIQEVNLDTNLMGRIFDYGDLTISTAATIGSVPFKMVPNPEGVQTIIDAQKRLVKAGRQAELHERMRGDLMQRLDLRLLPVRPQAALPPNTKLPPRTAWGRFRQRISNFWQPVRAAWQRFWRRVGELLLFPFSEKTKKRVMERRQKRRNSGAQDRLVYRKHWLFLLRATLITFPVWVLVSVLLFMAGLDALNGRFTFLGLPAQPTFLALGALWLGLFAVVWWKWENWRNDQYIVTDRYIIDVEALPFKLREQRRQASWDRVQNAIYEVPSLWANLFDYGSVLIQTAATESAFTFVNVPHPREVQREIFRRLEQFRLQQEDKEATDQHKTFIETLQIYDELMQSDGWATQRKRGYAPPPPGPPPGP